jgi:hypothetical protein
VTSRFSATMGFMELAYVGMACVALSVFAAGASAQDTTRVRLIGEVRDYATEQPIRDIAVRILELDRVQVTDANGFFAFDSVPLGRWTFEASGFGYVTSVQASEIGPRSLMLIRLESAPIELEGLYVSVMQRLVRRRLSVPSRVIAWERAELAEAIAPDVGSFVRTRGVAEFRRCGGEYSDTDLPNCFFFRGDNVRLTVFVDDLPLLQAVGTSTLWSHDPRDLWSVELLPGCGQLRIYTQRFMELVEAGRVRLDPLIIC